MMSRAEAQDAPFETTSWVEPAETYGEVWTEQPGEEPEPSTGLRVLAAVLVAAALAWVAFCVYLAVQTGAPSVPAIPGLAVQLTAPLILLAALWLIFGRAGRRETERYTRAVATMRSEAQALESVLQIVTGRLEEHGGRMTDATTRLMGLGDEASDRLGRVTHYLSKETAELDRKAQALEAAAANARVDIGVLLTDLPRAEASAQAAASALKSAGMAAHEQTATMDVQLYALQTRAREVEELSGGAAQRLAAQLSLIETNAAAAAERLGSASERIGHAVDGSLERAAAAIEQNRTALDLQGQAMLATVQQGRSALEAAGAEAAARLAERLDGIGAQLNPVAEALAAQEARTTALMAALERQVTDVDAQLHALERTGESTQAQLLQSVEAVRASVRAAQSELASGGEQSGVLIAHTQQLAELLAGVGTQLRDELPQALATVREQTAATAQAAEAAVAPAEAIQAAAALAAESLVISEASIARQQESADALLSVLREGVGAIETQLAGLSAALTESDASAARLTQQSAPELIEALLRVRETANQAAAHAREAIASAIPTSAAALAEAAQDAVSEAVTEPVRLQIASLGVASDQAVATARRASERLTRQLLAIGETAAAVEQRFADERADRETKDAEALSRRVALLIESLNSTAIDVTKILSNEVTDTAWTAYLKGDRGVFTRRAVRLLESGEAREILRHYEEEPEFREQVNRYIHDFESLLRRVLADRDGSPLSVTLLSSDMGKLYVALAQAIERFRR